MGTTTPTQADFDRHYYRLMLVYLAGLAILLGIGWVVPPTADQFFVGESGPIQIFSAAAYLTVVVALCRESDSAFLRRHVHLVIIPILMCLREMDFHSRFTTMSITKLPFYFSPQVSIAEKAYGVAAFALVIWAGLMLLRNARNYLADLRRGRSYAAALFGSAFLTVFSKTIDGLGRKLATLGIAMPHETQRMFGIAEEILELGIPLLFLVAVFAYFPFRRIADMPQS